MAMIVLLCADCTEITLYLHIVDLWLLCYACNGSNVNSLLLIQQVC